MPFEIREIVIRTRLGTGTMSFSDSDTGTTGSLEVKVPGAGAMPLAAYEKLMRAEVQRVLKALSLQMRKR